MAVAFRFTIAAAVAVLPAAALAQGVDHRTISPPPVIVDLGKPNVWTMDQAHYLLERNRALDLGLKEAALNDLDPNALNGIRVDVLRSLISASVAFNGADRASNRNAVSDYNTQLARYNSLRDQRDNVRTKVLALDDQIASIQGRMSSIAVVAGADSDAYKAQAARLQPLNDERATRQDEYDRLTTDMGAAPTRTALTATGADDAAGSNTVLGDDKVFSSLLDKYAKGTDSTKLAASLQLENHINLQYEMVAKQLTLLRDQAGPDNRVIFLELPQSIYYTEKLRLYPYIGGFWGSHVVQSWYRLDEALIATPPEGSTGRPASKRELLSILPMVEDGSQGCKALDIFFRGKSASVCSGSPNSKMNRFGLNSAFRDLSIAPFTESLETSNSSSSKKSDQQAWAEDWSYSLLLSPLGRANKLSDETRVEANTDMDDFSSPAEEQPMYALDLIPRQSALNVADANVTSRNYGFAGLFKFLSGIGAKARYERQRDQFGQFIQEETYASAFGKGGHEFGWTFGPLPGTNRMAPGLRTTYAVVVVPKYTRVIRVYGVGCGYRRRRVPMNPFAIDEPNIENRRYGQQNTDAGESCSQVSTFDIEIPSASDSFELEKASCHAVGSGQRAVLTLQGRFNEQTGMLINGTPLPKVPSIAQPLLVPTTYKVDPAVGDSGIQGSFEMVSDKKLVASFVMGSFVGSPEVTLVTAGQSISKAVKCDLKPDYLEGGEASVFLQPTTITNVRVTVTGDKDSGLNLLVFGQNFKKPTDQDDPTVLLVNQNVIEAMPYAEKPVDPTLNKYSYIADGILKAHVTRDPKVRSGTIDYVIHNADQTLDIQGKFTDDLPPWIDPALPKCEALVAAKGDSATGGTFQCTVNGNFFSDSESFPPRVVDSKKDKDGKPLLSIDPATMRKDEKTWIVVLQTTDGKGGNISFGTTKYPMPPIRVEPSPKKATGKTFSSKPPVKKP